ncbi:MAG: choice-of-anchor tandem repeat GloVer-containing protein, partial [Candidatus Cybelea sp.]
AFYGTTLRGGAYGGGTVFKITPSGDEKVIYSFKGPPDGSFPQAGLIAVSGELYGTTQIGGNGDPDVRWLLAQLITVRVG